MFGLILMGRPKNNNDNRNKIRVSYLLSVFKNCYKKLHNFISRDPGILIINKPVSFKGASRDTRPKPFTRPKKK